MDPSSPQWRHPGGPWRTPKRPQQRLSRVSVCLYLLFLVLLLLLLLLFLLQADLFQAASSTVSGSALSDGTRCSTVLGCAAGRCYISKGGTLGPQRVGAASLQTAC